MKVSWHENLCVTAFLATSGNKYCCGNTFSCFLGLKIFFGVFAFKTLVGLELISLTITSNTFAVATLSSVSWTYQYFMCFLLSIPLHRLELISFSAKPAEISPGLKNIFIGSFAFHTPAQTGADYLFGNTCQQELQLQHFFVSWTYKYFYGFFAFHTPEQIRAELFFGNTWQ